MSHPGLSGRNSSIADRDRKNRRYVLQCDACDKLFEDDLSEEYSDVWNRAKAESWETRRVSGAGWVHLCLYCASPGND
jgi:hypothetical protein